MDESEKIPGDGLKFFRFDGFNFLQGFFHGNLSAVRPHGAPTVCDRVKNSSDGILFDFGIVQRFGGRPGCLTGRV